MVDSNIYVIIILTVLYFITSSVTTFDIRMIQDARNGNLSKGEQMLPKWVQYVYWVDWGLLIALVVLNWKFALMVFVIKFALKVLPILETFGNIFMSPFRKK